MTVPYSVPTSFIDYKLQSITKSLIDAKAAIAALTNIPFQRSWADALQDIELKREVAGTSKIEGADFTDREFEEAVADQADEMSLSRSQRQARAAINAYKWIATIPSTRPVAPDLVLEIHRRIVTGCDEDHCQPGALRPIDHNVTFGRPRHRGAIGGAECRRSFDSLCEAIQGSFREHDSLIQAFAAHYHLGAIHPFGDGNSRTARALEALLLRRSDLRDTLFIAMSNFYYDEKDEYLRILSETAKNEHNLDEFLSFCLNGLTLQCNRLLREIKRNISKVLFRDVMSTMYGRLKSTRKRVLAIRQVKLLEKLLEYEKGLSAQNLLNSLASEYGNLTESEKAFVRDVNQLVGLKAVSVKRDASSKLVGLSAFQIAVRLEWPMEITETSFFAEIEKMPQAKTRLMIG